MRRVARMERDARDSAGRCAALEKEFPWIAGERQLFGRPSSDYDWSARDPDQVQEEYRSLEEKLKTLTRGLNKRVRILPSFSFISRFIVIYL